MGKPAKKKPDGMDKSYELHTGAVNDLVTATKENTPQYSEAELKKYRSGARSWHLPEWLKVILIKFWFFGAVCFFAVMGLGIYLGNNLDLYVVTAIILGLVIDLLLNHFLRFTEKLKGGSKRWIMVTRGGAAGTFLNVLYGAVLMVLVMTAYALINMVVAVGVEPLLFGVLCTAADGMCIAMKRSALKMVNDARNTQG